MKRGLLLGLVLIFTIVCWAQKEDTEKVISQGIQLYNNGLYEDAIEKFNQAIKLDGSSSTARYELSLASFAIGDYQNSIKYSSQVIKMFQDNMLEAFLVCGAAYEKIGKYKKAEKTYKNGIKAFPSYYMLRYNLALLLYDQKKLKESSSYLANSIELYPGHSSSHLLLAYVMIEMGEYVKSMLPLYYFLLIEQDTDRSLSAYELLESIRLRGSTAVSRKKYRMNLAGAGDDVMSVLEMKLDSIGKDNLVGDKSDKLKQFAYYNSDLFNLLLEYSDDHHDFWWDFYGEFFSGIESRSLTVPFSYFISNCKYNREVLLWLSDNQIEFKKFSEWMEIQ